MDDLLLQWSTLAGFGALIAFVVNVLKSLGLVRDGQAPTWSAALNLLGLAGLLALRVYAPQVDIVAVDEQVAQFVEVGLVVFAYIVQLLGSKVGHAAARGAPLIGKTWSR